MGVTSWLAEKIGAGAGEVIDKVAGAADRFIETAEDKKEFELAVQEAHLKLKRLELDMEIEYQKDRASARAMYSQDDKSQKLLTLVFSIGYFALTIFMLYYLLGELAVELDQFTTVFVSSVFGAFNAIMVQIVSFYFGSSKGGEDVGREISRSFNRASGEKESK